MNNRSHHFMSLFFNFQVALQFDNLMEELITDVQYLIFNQLRPEDLLSMMFTCKRFANSEVLWRAFCDRIHNESISSIPEGFNTWKEYSSYLMWPIKVNTSNLLTIRLPSLLGTK
jgi:hypothetical protein